jgi:large subunit ribosomal protein L15
MQFHNLQPNTKRKAGKRIGRGGKRGTYSGRGIKGQLARSGHKLRPELRDILKKIPKKRGYFFHGIQTKLQPVNLETLEKAFSAGETVSPKSLREKKIVRAESGKIPGVKILGTGSLTKKLSVEGCAVSAKAKEAIEKAGGTVSQKVISK